ncbi:hypothetical protein VNO80_15547 [Phaseolus coccineus]|uniref:Uncharacterized protein n=1 Tax=Phaseolus coccineus TaxID=3886 RepID=A0AAN9MKG4_PHACN
MSLAPWRCPHASRPDDARMPRTLTMPACLSRPGVARMLRTLAKPACLSRPGDVRIPRALAIHHQCWWGLRNASAPMNTKKTVILIGRRYPNFPSYPSSNPKPQRVQGKRVCGPRNSTCPSSQRGYRQPPVPEWSLLYCVSTPSWQKLLITNPNRNREKIPQKSQQKRRKSKQFLTSIKYFWNIAQQFSALYNVGFGSVFAREV